MGYRGKVEQQARARELRLAGWSLVDIARELGVSKSSVSLWVRDLGVVIEQRRNGFWNSTDNPHPAQRRKLDEIAQMNEWGVSAIGDLTRHSFLVAGAALYAGEGGKTDGCVSFPNSDPAMIVFFLEWLRTFFAVDEERLRVRLYLHEGLDIDAAEAHWSDLTGIPLSQFGKPYRAVADPSIRTSKHPFGCPRIDYACSRTHRAVMGLVRALLSSKPAFRGGAIGSASDC